MAKIGIYDHMRVHSERNYEYPGQRWVPKLVCICKIQLAKRLDQIGGNFEGNQWLHWDMAVTQAKKQGRTLQLQKYFWTQFVIKHIQIIGIVRSFRKALKSENYSVKCLHNDFTITFLWSHYSWGIRMNYHKSKCNTIYYIFTYRHIVYRIQNCICVNMRTLIIHSFCMTPRWNIISNFALFKG